MRWKGPRFIGQWGALSVPPRPVSEPEDGGLARMCRALQQPPLRMAGRERWHFLDDWLPLSKDALKRERIAFCHCACPRWRGGSRVAIRNRRTCWEWLFLWEKSEAMVTKRAVASALEFLLLFFCFYFINFSKRIEDCELAFAFSVLGTGPVSCSMSHTWACPRDPQD